MNPSWCDDGAINLVCGRKDPRLWESLYRILGTDFFERASKQRFAIAFGSPKWVHRSGLLLDHYGVAWTWGVGYISRSLVATAQLQVDSSPQTSNQLRINVSSQGI